MIPQVWSVPPNASGAAGWQVVSVGPPDEEGGRLVFVRGIEVGRAYGLWDVIVFCQRAGLVRGFADEDEIAASEQIRWLGGGPDMWEP